ncbi:MAG: PQQ-dependent catabolism-associated CXXCW motif protein, partial [Aestuariivirgaceae bacterium]
GYGRLHPDADRWFRGRLMLLTAGNKHKPLLFYCLMDCWMSWNAAKRALEYGYQRVIWFPEGTDGWGFEDYPLKARYPEMYIE